MNTDKSKPSQQPREFNSSFSEQLSLKSSPMELTSEEVRCMAEGGKGSEMISTKLAYYTLKNDSKNLAISEQEFAFSSQQLKASPQQVLPENFKAVVSDEVTVSSKHSPQFSPMDFEEGKGTNK